MNKELKTPPPIFHPYRTYAHDRLIYHIQAFVVVIQAFEENGCNWTEYCDKLL